MSHFFRIDGRSFARAILGVFVALLFVGTLGAQDVERARRRVYPALVNISVVTRTYAAGRVERALASGSGTLISPAGHVVTNYHVVENAARVSCTLGTGETFAAEVLGTDLATDVAVLKLHLERRPRPTKPLPFATFGDSDRLLVGDPVVAMGNPLALTSSLTLGVVSNTARVLTDGLGNADALRIGSRSTGQFTRWIQHDALILPGNSGGPLVDLEGSIVGVNTRGGNGVGFASPSNLVRKVVDAILTDGEVRRGLLGVSILPVEKRGLTKGALVASVGKGSPAAVAGIIPGDVLLRFGEQEISCRFIEEVPLVYGMIAETPPGTTVSIRWDRAGSAHQADVVLDQRPAPLDEPTALKELGITALTLTPELARENPEGPSKGLIVTGVRPAKPFEIARPPLRSGDVIEKVGEREITDVASLLAAFAATNDEEAVVRFRRGDEALITLVPVVAVERRPPGGALQKAWLGVRTQVLTSKLAKALGLADQKGFRVTLVYPFTKASAAGLLSGDIIVSVDGEPLKAFREQDARDLIVLIENMSVGEDVTLGILRDGKPQSIELELEPEPMPATEAGVAKDDTLEFEVRDILLRDRIAERLGADVVGVIVVEATSGGWASVAGLSAGDLLLTVNGEPVVDRESFLARFKKLAEEKPATIELFVRRGSMTTFLFVEPDWK